MGEKWCVNQEEEALHRHGLLRKARKGDEKATRELQRHYSVRVWSEKERAKLVYTTPELTAKVGKGKARKA